MEKTLEYGDAINIIQAVEREMISEIKDAPLFDYEVFHETILVEKNDQINDKISNLGLEVMRFIQKNPGTKVSIIL